MLKVGDIVRLREDSQHHGQSGGADGTITTLFDHDYKYRIKWKGGRSDRYRDLDVNLVAQTWKQRLLQ